MNTLVEALPTIGAPRDPASCARVLCIMDEGITLVSAAAKSAEHEAATLTVELQTAEKAVKELRNVAALPANVAAKLSRLHDRLAAAERNAAIQQRILGAKQSERAAWLAQGDPTNAELISRDSLLDKALDSVRRLFT